MHEHAPLLVFSDLDGTLLDHDTYSAAPALPAVQAVLEFGGGIVLASSKTGAEMVQIRDALGLGDWPLIVENGAGIIDPHDIPTSGGDYSTIRSRLAGLPPGFRGFGDMDTAEVAAVTGLNPDQAALAQQRCFTEPGLWTGPQEALGDFLEAAAEAGLTARRGGRFLTLSLGGTKAEAMAALVARLRPGFTLALGDAPNDIEMIQSADRGVIIANPHGTGIPPLDGEATGKIIRMPNAGPAGWYDAVMDSLNTLTKGTAHG